MSTVKTGLKGRTVSKNHFSSSSQIKSNDSELSKIVITFLDGNNLLASDLNTGKSDPVGFVWCGYESSTESLPQWDDYNKPESGIILTNVCNTTCDPIWNEELTFPIEIPRIECISDIICRIAIRDEDVDSTGGKTYEDLGQVKIPLLDVITKGKPLKNSYILPPTKFILEKITGMHRVDGYIRLKIALIFSPLTISTLSTLLPTTPTSDQFTKCLQSQFITPVDTKSRAASPAAGTRFNSTSGSILSINNDANQFSPLNINNKTYPSSNPNSRNPTPNRPSARSPNTGTGISKIPVTGRPITAPLSARPNPPIIPNHGPGEDDVWEHIGSTYNNTINSDGIYDNTALGRTRETALSSVQEQPSQELDSISLSKQEFEAHMGRLKQRIDAIGDDGDGVGDELDIDHIADAKAGAVAPTATPSEPAAPDSLSIPQPTPHDTSMPNNSDIAHNSDPLQIEGEEEEEILIVRKGATNAVNHSRPLPASGSLTMPPLTFTTAPAADIDPNLTSDPTYDTPLIPTSTHTSDEKPEQAVPIPPPTPISPTDRNDEALPETRGGSTATVRALKELTRQREATRAVLQELSRCILYATTTACYDCIYTNIQFIYTNIHI